MSREFLIVLVCVVLAVLLREAHGYKKREVDYDYPEYQMGVRYDEYPLIVPRKRTATLINRLMVAFKNAMEKGSQEEDFKNDNRLERYPSRPNKNYRGSADDVRSMDLQRRGHGNLAQQKGRLYWRCYFNAVTCF